MSLRILKIISVIAVLLPSLAASAAERITLWGIYNGCERIAEFDRLLDRHLTKAGVNTWALAPPASACQGEACAERAQAGCGLSDGLLLGGRIWRTKVAVRVRLWLYDLATHKTAYEDEYCQDCDLKQLLVEVTDRIRQNPKFGTGGGAEPAYCAAATSQAPADPRRNKLYFLVHGEGKGRAQVQAGLKDMLADTLRPLHPAPGDKKQYSHDDLMRIVGPQKEGQVLGVELYKEGGAQVWLFDGLTEHLASEEVKCKECTTESLIQSIRSTLPELWGHCFDTQCSIAVGKPQAGTEACEPVNELTCNEPPASLGMKGTDVPTSTAGIDPTLAKTIKALTWGAFAASAVSGIILASINSKVVQRNTVGAAYTDTLTGPAWTMGGVSAGLLALNIPITIMINRAQRSTSKPSARATTSAFRCPN